MKRWDEDRLDIRQWNVTLAPIMARRIDMAAQKGCQGVEFDNVDCWQNDCVSDIDPITDIDGREFLYEVQLHYNRWLAEYAHRQGLAAGLKNDLRQARELSPYFDFAINEQCFAYNECHMLRPFVATNKAVFGTSYESTGPSGEGLCAQAHGLGYAWLLPQGNQWFECPAVFPTCQNTGIQCPKNMYPSDKYTNVTCPNGVCSLADCCVTSPFCSNQINCTSARPPIENYHSATCGGAKCLMDECCEPATCDSSKITCGNRPGKVDGYDDITCFGDGCSVDDCCLPIKTCSYFSGPCPIGTTLNPRSASIACKDQSNGCITADCCIPSATCTSQNVSCGPYLVPRLNYANISCYGLQCVKEECCETLFLNTLTNTTFRSSSPYTPPPSTPVNSYPPPPTPRNDSVAETRPILLDVSYVEGGWTQWSACSVSCGKGGLKVRECNEPAPKKNGTYCLGMGWEPCNTQVCHEIEDCPNNPIPLNCTTAGSKCIKRGGSFECMCAQGYTGNGTYCTDVDECVSGYNVTSFDNVTGKLLIETRQSCASDHAACANTVGSFKCGCKAGFARQEVAEGMISNELNCMDIDECASSANPCKENTHSACKNSIGSFSCECVAGYAVTAQSNGTCVDVDECSGSVSPCHVHATCTNGNGSFTCTCKSGFSGNGTQCIDIEPPKFANNGTDILATTTVGSLTAQVKIEPGATDNVGVQYENCSISVAELGVGSHPIDCLAVDAVGNVAKCRFYVKVTAAGCAGSAAKSENGVNMAQMWPNQRHNESTTLPCPLGYFGTPTRRCNLGISEITGNCSECPVGKFCKGGVQYNCPRGTYQENTGKSDCPPIPATHVCSVHVEDDTKCSAIRPKNILPQDQHLNSSSRIPLESPCGKHQARVEADGNFVLAHETGSPYWSTNTHNEKGEYKAPFSLGPFNDGNLILWDAQGKVVWQSYSGSDELKKQGPFEMVMEDDGNLVVKGKSGTVWESGTHKEKC